MTRYAIGLGSNLGDRLENLVEAWRSLDRLGEVVAVSSLYETAPVGGPEQDPYLNAVVVLDCALSPEALLEELHEVERAMGRERVQHWGPRTLDLDIVASDLSPVVTPGLVIPHPRAGERRFVLEPLAEVWPEALVDGETTAREALTRVPAAGVDRLLAKWAPSRPRWPDRALVAAQMVILVLVGLALAGDGTLPRGEVTVTRLIGAFLASAGMGLAFVASRRLGPALRPGPEPAPRASLVMSGPYRHARHPVYGGLVLLMMGTALILDSVYGVVGTLCLAGFFWVKSSYEERLLRVRFPAYRLYREVVTRRLIPYVL